MVVPNGYGKRCPYAPTFIYFGFSAYAIRVLAGIYTEIVNREAFHSYMRNSQRKSPSAECPVSSRFFWPQMESAVHLTRNWCAA
jgi:hypothetical protein